MILSIFRLKPSNWMKYIFSLSHRNYLLDTEIKVGVLWNTGGRECRWPDLILIPKRRNVLLACPDLTKGISWYFHVRSSTSCLVNQSHHLYFGSDTVRREERVAERWMRVWFIFPDSCICLFTYSNFSYPGNFESFPTIVARKLASW